MTEEEKRAKKKTRNKAHYEANSDKAKARDKAYYEANLDKAKACRKAYREANSDKEKARSKAYREANPDKVKAYHKAFRQANPDKVKARRKAISDMLNAATAKRRAKKLHATPSWLTNQDLEHIKFFYSLAKDMESLTGAKYHVDHIVPLQGRNVSGLHVPWNLQVITATNNLSKSNKVQ